MACSRIKTNYELASEQALAESKARNTRRIEIREAGGSCLSCSHVSAQRGVFLFCSKKAKNVRQYNYCESWKPVVKESEEK